MDTRRLASLALRLASLTLGVALTLWAVRGTYSAYPPHPPEYVIDGGTAFAGAFIPPIAVVGGLLVGFAVVRSSDRLKCTRWRVAVYLFSTFLATSFPVVYLNVWSYRATDSGLTHLDWYLPALICCLVVALASEFVRYARLHVRSHTT